MRAREIVREREREKRKCVVISYDRGWGICMYSREKFLPLGSLGNNALLCSRGDDIIILCKYLGTKYNGT